MIKFEYLLNAEDAILSQTFFSSRRPFSFAGNDQAWALLKAGDAPLRASTSLFSCPSTSICRALISSADTAHARPRTARDLHQAFSDSRRRLARLPAAADTFFPHPKKGGPRKKPRTPGGF
jgi:hypothetical protein